MSTTKRPTISAPKTPIRSSAATIAASSSAAGDGSLSTPSDSAVLSTSPSSAKRPYKPRSPYPAEKRTGKVLVCPICGTEFYKPLAWIKKVRGVPTCGNACRGAARSRSPEIRAHLKQIAGRGREGWTAESHASYQQSMSGERNPAWKGGVTYFKKHGNYTGVKYVRCPVVFHSMARKDGYVMEHRLMVAQAIGRPLLRSEVVHHKDHNPANNALDNLQLFATNRDHKLYEHHGAPAPIWQL